jgi:hypothetical protein
MGGAVPVIDLPSEPPIPGANTYYYPVQAVMLYPRDEESRLHWFAAAMAASYSMWHSEGAALEVLSDFHGWIGVLWEFRQAPQRVYSDGMARVSRAALSGHVLLYLLRLARHHPRHCKVERAKALVVNFAPMEGETISESLVDKAWADFKPVSHMWAALDQLIRQEWVPDSNDNVLRFLAQAEAIRADAESARLLDPAESWRVADGQDLPAIDPPIALPPLAGDMVEYLERYFPT